MRKDKTVLKEMLWVLFSIIECHFIDHLSCMKKLRKCIINTELSMLKSLKRVGVLNHSCLFV